MIDTEKMREAFACLTSRVSSHYDGCEYVHPICAIELLLREVERLRKEVKDRMWDTGELGCDEKYVRPLFPTAEEVDALNKALLKSGKRVGSKPDWLSAPDTMPSDLAPAQMVEAEEYHTNEDTPQIGILPAKEVPWNRVTDYRPLYSDSGLPLCSAESLEEWAQFAATDASGVVNQYETKPYFLCGKLHWEQARGCIDLAPESHRRPGSWTKSLIEVMR